jgi:hypothetical protein
LLGRLDGVGAHSVEIEFSHLRVACRDRGETRNPHLHGLLHHVVETGMFERGKHEMQVASESLGLYAPDKIEDGASSALARQTGQPLPVTAIEYPDRSTVGESQNVA